MNNANSPGNHITTAAPAAVSSGVPFILGILLAIPVTDAAAGELVACAVEGVFDLPKLDTDDIAAGAAVNWSSAGNQVIAAAGTAADLDAFGVAVDAAGAGSTHIRVKLTPGTGAAGTAA